MPYLDRSTVPLEAVTTFSIPLYLHRDHSNFPVRAGYYLWMETELCSVYPADPSMSLLPGLGLGVGIQSTTSKLHKKGQVLPSVPHIWWSHLAWSVPLAAFETQCASPVGTQKQLGQTWSKVNQKLNHLGHFRFGKNKASCSTFTESYSEAEGSALSYAWPQAYESRK